ncbi:putative hydro-lyase [Streptomycetaceae bacterium NBC_01309]
MASDRPSEGTVAQDDVRDVAHLAPAAARAAFRAGAVAHTSGWAHGFTQANMLAVPQSWAYDVLLFTQRNRKPCPVLDVVDAGETASVLASDADLRTDLPRYRIWRDGELADEPTDVAADWRADLVTFLIGCSFTFETGLSAAGVPLRHVEQGRNVPMFVTDRECRAGGRVHGPMVVSMRPIPRPLVATATRVSGLMPDVHGAPVHIGEPAELGITDPAAPDFGDPVTAHDGDVPVFWACGVTLQTAVMASKPPFAITHAPGHMFVTDTPDSAYRIRT